MTSKCGKTNIYSDYIIPTIQSCKEGESLVFVSPSTFFGYYSLGAHNFERMCETLEKAREKKVKIQLIVNIYEPFSALAGKALLGILKDKEEIRNYTKNHDIYFIARINENNKERCCYYEFVSQDESPKPLKYLHNIKYLAFESVGDKRKDILKSEKEMDRIRRYFDHFWNRAAGLKEKIREHDVYYHKKKLRVIEIIINHCIVLFAGIIIGIALIIDNLSMQVSKIVLTNRFVFPLMLGILTGLISTYVCHRLRKEFKKIPL